jgi:hypothetical protein
MSLYPYVRSGRSWVNQYGICLFEEHTFKLINLPSNSVYVGRPEFDSVLNMLFNGQYSDRLTHFPIQLADTVYFLADFFDGPKVVKYKFSISDFDTTHSSQVYTPNGNTGAPKNKYIWALPLIILVGAGLGLLYRKSNKVRPKNDSTQEVVASTEISVNEEHVPETSKLETFMSLLTPVDKELLTELALCTRNNQFLEIQNINKILGVSKKEISLQKNRRSTTISNINTLFQQIIQSDEPLILRQKDELDKRVFHYYMNKEYVSFFDRDHP